MILSISRLLLTSLVLIGSHDASSAQAYPPVTPDWVVLRPARGGYHILMPPGWIQGQLLTPHAELVFRARQPTPPSLPGVTTCNVTVEDAPETRGYTQAELGDMANTIAKALHGKLLRATVTRLANRPAYLILLETPYEALDVRVTLVFAEAMVFHPGRTFVVGCGAGDKTPETAGRAWEAWKPMLYRIMSIFGFED